MFDLRYYQEEAKAGVAAAFDRYRSTACIMATATGKTELFLSIAVAERGRVLVLVHRDYLITSPLERLKRVGFTDVAVEKAESRSEGGFLKKQIVFASVQSIGPESQKHRLRTFDPKDFSLLVIDEGHRAVSQSYRNVQQHMEAGNPKLKTLILTATPKRKDGIALGTICESVAYEMSPGKAAEEGWITPPRFFVRDVPTLDFSKVLMKGSDLDQEQVAAILAEEESLHKLCASLADDQGPTIVFCPNVAVSQAYAKMMDSRYRRGKARAIHQHSTPEEMEEATKGLADGSIDYVMNCDKLTEGYDVPRVVRVAWAAPTASLVRWTQGCGRGFRPDAGIAKHLVGGREDSASRRLLIEQSSKPFCSIVTYHPSNCQHQICTSVDLLGGNDLTDNVKKFAVQVQDQTSRQPTGSDTKGDIETAKVFCELLAALEDEHRNLRAKATVRDAEFDGMGGASVKMRDDQPSAPSSTPSAVAATWKVGEWVTDKQKWWFRRQGLPPNTIDGLTKTRASVVRDLVEKCGVKMATALGYAQRQAFAVLDSMKSRKESGGAA